MALAPEVEVLISTLALLPMAVMTTDCNGVVQWTNAYFDNLTGYAIDEVVGQNVELLVVEETAHALGGILRQVIATGEAWKGEAVGRNKVGELYDIDQTITPIKNGSNAVTHALWTLRKHTEHMVTTDALAQLQEVIIAAQLVAHFEVFTWNVRVEKSQWSPETFHRHGLNPKTTDPSFYAWFQTIHLDDRDRILREFQQLLDSPQGAISIEYRSGNGMRWFAGSTRLYRDMDGKPDHFVGINIDITDRKRTEIALKQANESLAKAERHYRHIFNSGSDAVFVYNIGVDGVPEPFLEVNEKACNYLNYTREELLRMRVFDITPAEACSDVPAVAQKLLADGQLISEGEMVTKDGPRIPVEINYCLSRVDGSRTIVAAVRNIAQRKQIEGDIRLDGEIMNNIRDGVLVVRAKDGVIVHANKQSLAMCGYGHEEMIGMHLSKVNASKLTPVGVSRDIIRALHQNDAWVGDIQATRKDGTEFWCNAVITAFQHEKYGEVWVGVYRDTTEVRRREVEQVKLENQFRQAQKLDSVGRLAGGVAHDFNNLLTVINGYSDFLLKELPMASPLRAYAEEIKGAGDRAGSLTKQLLAFSRKQVIRPSVLDLNAIIGEAARMLQRLIGETIVIEMQLDSSLGQVLADQGNIDQVIMNLAVNSRDAMPEGGKLAIETVNVELEGDSSVIQLGATPGSYVLLTVTDTGHGMDETIRQQIFEPFFTTKESGKGTGLGLSTVYGIIRQSNGWIDVSSEVGVGTSFKIYLPRINGCPLAKPSGIIASTQKGDETILVVEDQENVRTFVRVALEHCGYHVVGASTGAEAIAMAKQHSGHIHLLLTDVVLPGMDGKALSDRIRQVCPNLPVLFTTGYTADAIAHRGVLDKGVALLHKPFSPSELAAKVRDVLISFRKPTLASSASVIQIL